MEAIHNNNKWNISLNSERSFWKNYLIGIFIIIPNICEKCKKGHINLRNNESIINPLLGKCSYYKCNKEYFLRSKTIFEYNRNIPASVLYTILKLWLIDEFNVKKITNKLENIYNVNKIDSRFIYKFIQNNRIIISNYLRTVYALDPLAYKNAFQHIPTDESLFTHTNGEQTWVVGLINSETNQIRLEIVKNRDTETLKSIITKYVGVGNYIVTDAWNGYSFLSSPNSGYFHHIYNHGAGLFGSGADSTSRIESVWSELKMLLKKIYVSIRPQHFLYFLKEVEYRRSLKGLNELDKIKDFSNVVSVVGNGISSNLLDENELIGLDFETYFDD